MKNIFVFLVFNFISAAVICQTKPSEVLPISLGESTVYLHIFIATKPSDVVYAHVHENEVASLAAGLDMIKQYGGTIVSLSHSPEGKTNRNVNFKYQGSVYQFDPNRIYTEDDNRLKANITVVLGKGQVTHEVMNTVRNLANTITSRVSQGKLIIALHNNRNVPAQVQRRWFRKDVIDPESYNSTSYVMKCDHSSESNQSCDDIYINPKMNNSEFFITTQRNDFEMLSKKRITVVLQNQTPVDDGSMSVWAAKNNMRYLNSEAKHGRVKEQFTMLDALTSGN